MVLGHVFVDYDGTLTDVDTFDVLVRAFSGPQEWARLEAHLRSGTMSLRDVLAAQAHFVRATIDEADALLAKETQFDPSFKKFVQRCRDESASVTIVSSGIAPLIERALARNGLWDVPVLANAVDPRPDGWVMKFRDDSPNGHDKAAAVRKAAESGALVAYAGDGYSDFEAALVAHKRFAKKGRSLERYLGARGSEFSTFGAFDEIERALFG